ncbi:hypothetical protein GEMRC1_012261 [Eukaryota sp. GEM-RC1]
MTSNISLIEGVSDLPYLLSIPPTDELQPLFPLICFLHGYDEGPPTEIKTGICRHGVFSPRASPLTSHFICIAPQLPKKGDHWNKHAESVKCIIEHVHQHNNGNPNQTYLTGFSFGANGVFDISLRFPNFFAAIWPVDPTRVPHSDPEVPIWLSSGEISRCKESAFIAKLKFIKFHEKVTGERILVDYNQNHVDTATRAYADDRIYSWLLQYQLH